MTIVSGILFVCLMFAFLRLFWLQIIVLKRIVRPFEREDDWGSLLFRLPGKAKRARMKAFLRDHEHRDLRREWLLAWAATILLFVATLVSISFSGGPKLP